MTARRSPDADQKNAATWLALFGLVLAGAALLALTALVLPQIMAIVLVVAGLFVVPAAFHYLVWGWWLSQRGEQDESGDDSAG